MINCNVYIIRETLAVAVLQVVCVSPRGARRDAQLLWYLKQSREGDSVLAACVATSQLLLRDITADSLL